MRLIPILFAAAALVLVAPFGATGAGDKLRDDSLDAKSPASRSVEVSAILISASNEKGETDSRLASYENTLKRTLRFESFKFIGEGSVRIEMSGDAEIALPQDQSVKIEAAYYGEGMVWLRVIWMDGDRQVLNVVRTKCPRGKPIVVVGGPRNGENFAVIVTPR